MSKTATAVPVSIQNYQEGRRYIKKDQLLYACSSPVDILSLSPSQEVIIVSSKQIGRLVLEHDLSYVTKSGDGVRPAEAEAMRLVSQYTSVPVPEVSSKVSAPIMEISI